MLYNKSKIFLFLNKICYFYTFYDKRLIYEHLFTWTCVDGQVKGENVWHWWHVSHSSYGCWAAPAGSVSETPVPTGGSLTSRTSAGSAETVYQVLLLTITESLFGFYKFNFVWLSYIWICGVVESTCWITAVVALSESIL